MLGVQDAAGAAAGEALLFPGLRQPVQAGGGLRQASTGLQLSASLRGGI
jgi:hypothetical protein